MRPYLKRVLELTKPYQFRLVLGLLCGFLSGMLAFTLPVSVKLAVDTVFPKEPNSLKTAKPATTADPAAVEAPKLSAGGKKRFELPAPLKRKLDRMVNWFRPGDQPSRVRIVLVIALIPAAMLLRGVLAYLNAYTQREVVARSDM